MNTYVLVSAIVFFVFGFLFKTNTVLNTFCKIFFFGLGIVGAFYWAQSCGYILQIPVK